MTEASPFCREAFFVTPGHRPFVTGSSMGFRD